MRASFFCGLLVCGFSLAAACAGDGGGGSEDPGSSRFTTCRDDCTDEEYAPYLECLHSKCDATYSACYGPDWQSGKASGVCAPYMRCIQRCECGDTMCIVACVDEDETDCAECLSNSGDGCPESCEPPDCAFKWVDEANCTTLGNCCAQIADPDLKEACSTMIDAAEGDVERCRGFYLSLKGTGACN